MSRTIIQTRPGHSNFHLFEQQPRAIYSNDSLRLKQHDNINIEFLHSCFVLMDGEKPVGRIALYFNPSLNYNGKLSACAGNYECIDDRSASAQLISHIEEIARKNSFHYMLGPMNGSTWDNYRFSDHNDHPNFFLEPYHHIYYKDHFTSAEYKTLANYFSLIDRKMQHDQPEVKSREEQLKDLGVVFRNIRMEDYRNELVRIHDFSMHAFSRNFLFTPMSRETFLKKYLPLERLLKPEQVIIAEHEGNIAGIIFSVDDLYSKEQVLIIKTLARNMNNVYAGLGNVLANKMTKHAHDAGYKAIIHAFILDTNFSHKLSRDEYSGEQYKQYQLYSKEL